MGGLIFFKENSLFTVIDVVVKTVKYDFQYTWKINIFLLQNPKNQKKSVERRSIESFNLKWRMDYLLIQELMCMPIIY